MLKLARCITQLNIWTGKVCAWLIVPMFFALITDVVMRYLVGNVTIWTSELAQLIFGVYSVIAGGYLLVDRAHVNVDIFYGQWSRKKKARVDLATSFLFVFFMLVLIWQSSSMAWESAVNMETSFSIWDPYIWPVKLAVPIAGVLLFLQGLVRMVSDWRVIKGLENDPDIWGKQAADGSAH